MMFKLGCTVETQRTDCESSSYSKIHHQLYLENIAMDFKLELLHIPF